MNDQKGNDNDNPKGHANRKLNVGAVEGTTEEVKYNHRRSTKE